MCKSTRSSCCTCHKSWKATLFSKAQEIRKPHHGYLQRFGSRANKNLQVRAKSFSADTNMDRKGKQHRGKVKTIRKSFPSCLHGALTCMFQGLCWPDITDSTKCTFREAYKFMAQTLPSQRLDLSPQLDSIPLSLSFCTIHLL